MIQTVMDDSLKKFSLSKDDTRNKFTKQSFIEKFNFFIETNEDKLNVLKLGWKTSD